MKKLFLIVALWLIISRVQASDEDVKTEQVFLGIQKTFTLEGKAPFIGRYEITLKPKDIPKGQDKWYVFAMAQPIEDQSKLFGSPSKIEIMKVNESENTQKIKECVIEQETDACFIKNNQFDYKTEKLRFSISCDEQCKFGFVTQVDYAYPLKLNSPFKLKFEQTSYSKIFALNTQGQDFHQLRILLSPRGFIKYGQPIVLLANYGSQVPTKQKHDFKGMHIWNDGQGIFIRKAEMKQRTFTILVEGPQKNVLNLYAEGWMKQQRMELNQYWPEVDLLKTGQSREFIGVINETNLTHRIKIVTFSGALEFTKLYKVSEGISQKLTPLEFAMPSQKYGQYEFRLSKQLIKKENIKRFVIKVTGRKDTTYLINYAREEDAISTVLPYVSQSSLMLPNQTDQYFFKVEEIIQQAKQKKSSNIQIILGNIQGNIRAKFYKCNVVGKLGTDNTKNCEYKQSNKQDFTEILPVKYENRGIEKRYWFEIEWLDYVKKSDKDKTQIVFQMTAVIENTNEGKASSYQIQYKNKDRIYLLREGELVKDRVFIQQKRHYKLSIQDVDAIQVRVHCTKISGQSLFSGSFTDPRSNKMHEKILPVHGIISFKLQPDQNVHEVYVETEGVQNSLYSLTAQIIRKSQSSSSKKNGTGYNQLIVRQQIPYQFLISPQESIVLQIHSTSKQFNLNLKSSSAVKVCMTQNLASPPFAPNCEIQNDFFLSINEKITMDRGSIGNIGIKNNNDKNVTVKIHISSIKGKCEMVPMNEVMFKNLGENGKDGQGKSHHCLQYNLNKMEQVELVVELKDEYQYNEGSITATINDQLVIKMTSPSYRFTKDQVRKACQNNRKDIDSDSFCYLRVQIEGISNSKVRVLAQFTDESIRLIDGVAHPVHSIMKKSEPKHFLFGIHNIENITVFLENRVGEYKLYANILKYADYTSQMAKGNKNATYPTKLLKDFESSNPFYYLQQIINIPQAKIRQKCDDKSHIDCVLLISVMLDGQSQVLKSGKFVIQATQQNRQLKPNTPLSGFLQKKSIAFYNFQNDIQNGTMVVTINNQNKHCLDIYVRQGSERASASNNQVHNTASNTLILSKTVVGMYSITLQANENCPYTISISSNKNDVARIKKGTFTDINLKQNQQSFLIFENLVNQTFKILSLQKSGQVIISVKPIPRNELEQTLQNNFSNIKDWVWSNKDTVRVNNIDTRKNQPHPKYCVDCYYLININAQRSTQASLIIPTPDSQLPITTDSLIKDLLLANQTSTFRVFTQSNSQFEVYVQYGKIQITIAETGEQDKTVYKKTFTATKSPIIEAFNLSKTEQYQYLRYSKIKIQAQEDAYFSFAIISNSDPDRRGPSLKYGIPEYMFLDANKQKCLAGTMNVNSDQFMVSFPKTDKKNIQMIEVTLKVNSKVVSVDKQFGVKQMLIRTNSLGLKNESAKYEICFKSKQPISITLVQSSPVIYWPQKQSMVVKKQVNMTFGSEGRNIIELNQCKSRASTEIFTQFSNMQSTTSQVRQRRRANNIIEFYHYGSVFIKIKAEKATIRWFFINDTDGSGQGYENYKSGWIRLLKQGQGIEASAQPVLPIDERVKSTIQTVSYSFYAAKEQMELYSAMNCWQGEFLTKNVLVNVTSNRSLAKDLVHSTFDIEKELKPMFSKYSYFLIGLKAQLTVKTQEGFTQTYRFYYPYQQVSKELLQVSGPNVVPVDPVEVDTEQKGQSNWLSVIGYILVALIVVVATYLFYIRCAKRCFQKKHKLNQSMGMEMKYSDLTDH